MTEHHFFISTATDWVTAPNMLAAINKLPKCGLPNFTYVNIWRVPGDERSAYSILDFSPIVKGAELIYTDTGGDPAESKFPCEHYTAHATRDSGKE